MAQPLLFHDANFYPTLFEFGGPVPLLTTIDNPTHPYDTGCPNGLGFTVIVHQLTGNEGRVNSCFCTMPRVMDIAKVIFDYCPFYEKSSQKTLIYNGLRANLNQDLREMVLPGKTITFQVLEKLRKN